MRSEKRNRKLFYGILAGLVLALLIICTVFILMTQVHPPVVTDRSADKWPVLDDGNGRRVCGKCRLDQDPSGIWELYLQGNAYERGVANGKLTASLISSQEKAFIAQIRRMIPSNYYLHFLKYFIYWFNRDLSRYVLPEFREEIYGISLSASPDFDFIGNAYARFLNYHSAHDVGHAMQELSLVGCTSFGVWGVCSSDSGLLISRNFDFYMGDEFARDKIICFEKPDTGHAFMMITWAGMIGAVSGMNEEGLTVTINAARSAIPYSARTPISLLAREILQYASTVQEAFRIASARETFVSESLLIGSGKERKAVIIEKSPFRTELFDPCRQYILCSNHFQSPGFASDPLNMAGMREGSSLYRIRRLGQDILAASPLNVMSAARILRDQAGLNGKNIGMGNEKAINQLIAHHSVIFRPEAGLVWVSTSPWQLGTYRCYDLRKIFHTFAAGEKVHAPVRQDSEIPADPFLKTKEFKAFLAFRSMKRVIREHIRNRTLISSERSFIRTFIFTNPGFYETYSLGGEYLLMRKNYKGARALLYRALDCEVPTWKEKKAVIEMLAICNVRLR